MAVKKKQSKHPKGQNLIAATCAQVEDLMRTHIEGILDFVDNAEDKKEKVSFGVNINCAESEPQIDVTIRFSQSVTDSRTVQLDNPDQGIFVPVVIQAKEETERLREENMDNLKDGKKRSHKKKAKNFEPEDPETAAHVVAGEGNPETT